MTEKGDARAVMWRCHGCKGSFLGSQIGNRPDKQIGNMWRQKSEMGQRICKIRSQKRQIRQYVEADD